MNEFSFPMLMVVMGLRLVPGHGHSISMLQCVWSCSLDSNIKVLGKEKFLAKHRALLITR